MAIINPDSGTGHKSRYTAPKTTPKAPVSRKSTYSKPKPKSTSSAPSKPSAPKKTKEQEFKEKYQSQIDNEIDTYEQQTNNDLAAMKKQLDDQIARLREQGQAAIGRNNEYLEQQIAQLQEQKALSDQDIINLQNRRGGFYSGGTDYFLAENQRATQTATGDMQAEIGSRNAEILNSNNLAAEQALGQFQMTKEQAMNKISLLRQQAPDRVRELVDAALERQRQIELQERQFALQQEQARNTAARAAASNALARERFEWEKQQAQNGGLGGLTAQEQSGLEEFSRLVLPSVKNSTQASRILNNYKIGGYSDDALAAIEQALNQQVSDYTATNDVDSYNEFLMDLNRLSDRNEGIQLINEYKKLGVSGDTITQMLQDLNKMDWNSYSY